MNAELGCRAFVNVLPTYDAKAPAVRVHWHLDGLRPDDLDSASEALSVCGCARLLSVVAQCTFTFCLSDLHARAQKTPRTPFQTSYYQK